VEKSGGVLNINEFEYPFFIMVIQNIGYFKQEEKFSFEGADYQAKVEKNLRAENFRKFRIDGHMVLTYSHPDSEPKNLPGSNIIFIETKFDTIVLTVVLFDKIRNGPIWESFLKGLDSRPPLVLPPRSIVYKLLPDFGESEIFKNDVKENYDANTSCNNKLIIGKQNVTQKDFEIACPEERFTQLTFPSPVNIDLSGKKQLQFDKFLHFRQASFYNERVGKIHSSGTDKKVDQYFFFLNGKLVYANECKWSRSLQNNPEPAISSILEDKILKMYFRVRSDKYRNFYNIKM